MLARAPAAKPAPRCLNALYVLLRRETPTLPACRISRATRLRPTRSWCASRAARRAPGVLARQTFASTVVDLESAYPLARRPAQPQARLAQATIDRLSDR